MTAAVKIDAPFVRWIYRGSITRSPEPMTILIVEDDPVAQGVLSRIIAQECPSARILSARDPQDAKKTLQKTTLSLIIVDLFLEDGASGVDLWYLRKKDHPTLPFLMISGLPQEAIERVFKGHEEVPPYLRKPFLAEECRSVLRRILPRPQGDLRP